MQIDYSGCHCTDEDGEMDKIGNVALKMGSNESAAMEPSAARR